MHGAIVVRKGDFRIRRTEDLRDKTVVVMRGDIAEEYVHKHHLTDKIATTKTLEEALRQLAGGQHDAMVVQGLVGENLIRNLNLQNLEAVGLPLDSYQDFCFAVQEGDKELLALLNEGLARVIADGTRDRLHEKWIAPTRDEKVSQIRTIAAYVLVTLLLAGLVSYLWQRSLRAKVKARTHEIASANKELAFENVEKESRASELVIANLELAFQNEEKEMRADELVIANDHLEGLVEKLEQTEEARKKTEKLLRNVMGKLQEKEQSSTRFLSAASHDLRQLIAAAMLFVETLKLTEPTPDQNELITQLDQSMNVFSDMLGRLLDISRFDAGLIVPRFKSIPLEKLFSWLNHTFKQQALDHQLRFRLFLPKHKVLAVHTDMILLQSVLMNLVTNAIKFTACGGILISARIRGDQVLLQVFDSGIGIAEADIPHIFDEFFQVGNPQRNREHGLGLGLSICQRTMALLGSEVSCRSHPGCGSVFEFSLPLDGKPPAMVAQATAACNPLFADKQVVLVEDDAFVATAMLFLLRASGAKLRHFENAEEALLRDDIHGSDYYIADYALGGALTGLQFLEVVQKQRQAPIHAVIVTGETSAQFIDTAAGSPWPVLQKPVSLAKLIAGLQ